MSFTNTTNTLTRAEIYISLRERGVACSNACNSPSHMIHFNSELRDSWKR